VGFFRRSRPTTTAPAAPVVRSIEVTLSDGDDPLEVVGESHHQDSLWSIVGGHTTERVRCEVLAMLVAETDNPYDPNAISVWINGLHVGFLSRADAATYRPGIMALQQKYGHLVAMRGDVAGGGRREDGMGRLGVFLRHDATDFGFVHEEAHHDDRDVRTGRHVVAGGDLTCLDGLPDDDSGAIKFCRQLLASEQSPLVRHFVYLQLEHHLYRCREVFGSALTEFDAACQSHDGEMEAIRAALLARFDGIPFLETYRQMCIRQQKLHDWSEASRWAERGLALYGEEALRAEWPDDLRNRAAKAKEKLVPRPLVRTPTAHLPRSGTETEDLVCRRCQATFTRVVLPGRKPTLCPTCRGQDTTFASGEEPGVGAAT
jgi:hypothetical protein